MVPKMKDQNTINFMVPAIIILSGDDGLNSIYEFTPETKKLSFICHFGDEHITRYSYAV